MQAQTTVRYIIEWLDANLTLAIYTMWDNWSVYVFLVGMRNSAALN